MRLSARSVVVGVIVFAFLQGVRPDVPLKPAAVWLHVPPFCSAALVHF